MGEDPEQVERPEEFRIKLDHPAFEGTCLLEMSSLVQWAAVAKVSDLVAEMAASAREQAAGIGQLQQALRSVDAVTQQTAATSEEASSAASELSGQAQELADTVATFQLDGAPGRAAATIEPPPGGRARLTQCFDRPSGPPSPPP